MSKPIYLVGPPSVGKSTIGSRLAKLYGWQFYDIDRVIEERTGVRISDIFEIEGEPGFRARETRILEELSREKNAVISTGGGAILSEFNRELMANSGTVVYLSATAELILQRTRNDKTRPLLQGPDREEVVAELLKARGPFYEEIAHITMQARQQSAILLTKELERELEQYNECS